MIVLSRRQVHEFEIIAYEIPLDAERKLIAEVHYGKNLVHIYRKIIENGEAKDLPKKIFRTDEYQNNLSEDLIRQLSIEGVCSDEQLH